MFTGNGVRFGPELLPAKAKEKNDLFQNLVSGK